MYPDIRSGPKAASSPFLDRAKLPDQAALLILRNRLGRFIVRAGLDDLSKRLRCTPAGRKDKVDTGLPNDPQRIFSRREHLLEHLRLDGNLQNSFGNRGAHRFDNIPFVATKFDEKCVVRRECPADQADSYFSLNAAQGQGFTPIVCAHGNDFILIAGFGEPIGVDRHIPVADPLLLRRRLSSPKRRDGATGEHQPAQCSLQPHDARPFVPTADAEIVP